MTLIGSADDFEHEEPSGIRAEGQAVLDRLFPRSSMISWLYLDWEPGNKIHKNCIGDGQVGRWVIRHMIPAYKVLPDMLYALKRDNPRTLGKWEYNRRHNRYWWRSAAHPGLTLRKWQLWREFRCEARIFWVVQGSGGGHAAASTPLERKLRRQMGLPAEPPAPGELPYVVPDWRVWQNLIELDDVRKMSTDLLGRDAAHFSHEEQQSLEDFRWALYRNWCNQVDAAVDERAKRWWAHARNFAPRGSDRHERDYERMQEEFVTDRAVLIPETV